MKESIYGGSRQQACSGNEGATHQLDILRQITREVSHYVAKIVFVQPHLRHPEADIFEAGRVLGVGLEGGDLVFRELGEESGVSRPEEANVGDPEEDHGDSFEAKAESPADIVRDP